MVYKDEVNFLLYCFYMYFFFGLEMSCKKFLEGWKWFVYEFRCLELEDKENVCKVLKFLVGVVFEKVELYFKLLKEIIFFKIFL